MSAYTGPGQATLLYENRQGIFYEAETVAAGTLSQAFQLRRERGGSYPWGFAVEVAFSGAPGTFSIDIMGAETDAKANYVKIGAITAVNSSNVGRFDTVAFWPKYVAIAHTTFPNAVTTTALVTR